MNRELVVSVATMDMSVAGMVSKHERTVERRAGLTAFMSGMLAGLSVKLAVGVGSVIVRHQVNWMRDQAVWFRGAAAEIDASDRDIVLDPHWQLVNRLHALERRLAALQGTFTKMGAAEPSTVPGSMLAAVSDLHESVRDLRGAIQAYEADRCALAGNAQGVETSASFDEAAHRLTA